MQNRARLYRQRSESASRGAPMSQHKQTASCGYVQKPPASTPALHRPARTVPPCRRGPINCSPHLAHLAHLVGGACPKCAPRIRWWAQEAMQRLKLRATKLEVERTVLRAMCVGALGRTVWREGVDLLADYRFADNVHQLIFEAMREIQTDDPQIIRELLPARLNNKGFPDLDLETYFQPHNFPANQTIALIRAL